MKRYVGIDVSQDPCAKCSLSIIATIDDVVRFRKATDVGAYLELTPQRY